MLAEELTFVKAHIKDFDTPIAPCDLPDTADWSPTEVLQVGCDKRGKPFDGNVLLPRIQEEVEEEMPNKEEAQEPI